MLAAALAFSLMGAAVKIAAHELSNEAVVFWRSLLGWLFVLPALLVTRTPLQTKRVKGHALRAILGMAGVYAYFFSLRELPLANALLLNYSLPLFVPLIERVWLAQPFPQGIGTPLFVGFAGMCLVLKPGLAGGSVAAVLGALSGVFAASAQVGVRGLTRTEPVQRIVFYFGVFSTVIALPIAARSWTTPAATVWPVLVAIGVSATLGQLLMTRAYSLSSAARVGPFMYFAVVFASAIDWFVFRRPPDKVGLLGALLVIAAGVITLRLPRRGRQAARELG